MKIFCLIFQYLNLDGLLVQAKRMAMMLKYGRKKGNSFALIYCMVAADKHRNNFNRELTKQHGKI